MKTKLMLVTVILCGFAMQASAGWGGGWNNNWTGRYAAPVVVKRPEVPPPLVVKPVIPAAQTHLLTIGQYWHIKHSEAVILAQSAEHRGNSGEADRQWTEASKAIIMLSNFRNELDLTYVGPLS